MRSWLRNFLSLWHSKEDLLKKIDDVRTENDVLRSQLRELRKNARPVIENLLDDKAWGGLQGSLGDLINTMDYLDEEYPTK